MTDRVQAILTEMDKFDPQERAELVEELRRREWVRGWLAVTEPVSRHFADRNIDEAAVDAAFDQDRAERRR